MKSPRAGKLVYIVANSQRGPNHNFEAYLLDYCDLLPRDSAADACDRPILVAYV